MELPTARRQLKTPSALMLAFPNEHALLTCDETISTVGTLQLLLVMQPSNDITSNEIENFFFRGADVLCLHFRVHFLLAFRRPTGFEIDTLPEFCRCQSSCCMCCKTCTSSVARVMCSLQDVC